MVFINEHENPPSSAGGGGRFQVPHGNPLPPPFASITTPMFFQNVPTPKTTTVSPYGNFLDISFKDQKLL
jgi:hypothetical protein